MMSKKITTNNNQKQAKKQNLSFVIIKTSDGRFWGSTDTYNAPVIANAQAADIFELTELASGEVALKAASSGKYVSAQPQIDLAANSDEIGPMETFKRIQCADGKIALQLSDGTHYLSAKRGKARALTANAVKVGGMEQFIVAPVDFSQFDNVDTLSEAHACCGPKHIDAASDSLETDASVMWDDETHFRVVELGIRLLREGQTIEAREFIDWWVRRPHSTQFRTNIMGGLKDADYKSPWAGTEFNSYYMFEPHFYNPETKLNYMRNNNSAVHVGSRCFNESVNFGRQIIALGDDAPAWLYQRAGYSLGLSLHYLTDLTQPMHAANFTNFFGTSYPFGDQSPFPNPLDLRHAGFEKYADELVKKGYLDNYLPLRPEDLWLNDIQSAAQLLHDTSARQFQVFKDHVWWHANNKFRRFVVIRGIRIPEWENSWGTEADQALEASLKPAPRTVSRYVAYWMRCVLQSS